MHKEEAFRKSIVAERDRRGWNTLKLATESGVPYSRLHEWLNQPEKRIHSEHLAKLMAVLGLNKTETERALDRLLDVFPGGTMIELSSHQIVGGGKKRHKSYELIVHLKPTPYGDSGSDLDAMVRKAEKFIHDLKEK